MIPVQLIMNNRINKKIIFRPLRTQEELNLIEVHQYNLISMSRLRTTNRYE